MKTLNEYITEGKSSVSVTLEEGKKKIMEEIANTKWDSELKSMIYQWVYSRAKDVSGNSNGYFLNEHGGHVVMNVSDVGSMTEAAMKAIKKAIR